MKKRLNIARNSNSGDKNGGRLSSGVGEKQKTVKSSSPTNLLIWKSYLQGLHHRSVCSSPHLNVDQYKLTNEGKTSKQENTFLIDPIWFCNTHWNKKRNSLLDPWKKGGSLAMLITNMFSYFDFSPQILFQIYLLSALSEALYVQYMNKQTNATVIIYNTVYPRPQT